MTKNSRIVSLYFCTRNPPRYGDRVERTQDKEAYMESRTAREEEITNSPNAGSWLLSHHDLHLGEDI